MREFRPGSVPVFVLGGGPGAIAATEQLLNAGYGVTLVGGGEVLAGRGVFLRVGPLSLPVWPGAYRLDDGSPEESVDRILARAHAGGACIQPHERLKEVRWEGNRITELRMEGMLGEYTRRPRNIVLSSRVDEFLLALTPAPPEDVLEALNHVSFESVVCTHVSISACEVDRGERTELKVPEGVFRAMAAPGVGRRAGYWVHSKPGNGGDTESRATLQANFMAAWRSEFNFQLDADQVTFQTRVVRNAHVSPIAAEHMDRISRFLKAFVNLALLGQSATLVAMNVNEEVEAARQAVGLWRASQDP